MTENTNNAVKCRLYIVVWRAIADVAFVITNYEKLSPNFMK